MLAAGSELRDSQGAECPAQFLQLTRESLFRLWSPCDRQLCRDFKGKFPKSVPTVRIPTLSASGFQANTRRYFVFVAPLATDAALLHPRRFRRERHGDDLLNGIERKGGYYGNHGSY